MTLPPFTRQAASEVTALLATLLRPGAPVQQDPVLAAVQRHRSAFDAFQVAPEGEASLIANNEYDAATEALVATPCATRFGALALLAHLRWWLAEEAEFAAGHQPGYRLAQARAGDLALFLGTRLPASLRRPPTRRADRGTAGEARA